MAARSVVTVGNFDGVHLGHRAILQRARHLADQHNAALKVVTFEPHPATVLRPDAVPPRITGAEHKKRLLIDAGADQIDLLEPNSELLACQPTRFIEQLLNAHRPVVIVEGANFRFGKARAGDVQLLASLGQRLHLTSVVVDPVDVVLYDLQATTVSSSLVRWLVGHGRVADAACCLGRAFTLAGRVITGAKRGRGIGVPTANLDPQDYNDLLIPADGVYGGLVELPDARTCPAAISVGRKPTFAGQARCIEAHLLDFDADLYDQSITLRFARWLRDQRPFPGVDALRRQLEQDITDTRRLARHGLLEPQSSATPLAKTG